MPEDRFALGSSLGVEARARARRNALVAQGQLDPIQAAQADYTGGLGWDAFFGGLREQQDAANAEGRNYRVSLGSIGMPRTAYRQSLGEMEQPDESIFDRQARAQLARSMAASDASEMIRARELAQRAALDKQQADLVGTLSGQYDENVLASTLAPQAPGTDLERIERLPAHLRLSLKGPLEGLDLSQRKQKLEENKLAEVVRGNKATEAMAAGSMMSPDAIEQNARLYLQTGTMPPLGMRDPNNRQRILNRAAELSAGGGGNIAANKADYKADAGSLASLQKQRDTIGAFEQTAMKNIDIFLNAAGKVVDTGSPLANMLVRQVSGKALGSPDQAAYEAARQVAINEIAKITSNPNLSGQLSDTARHEVEAFNPASATLAQSVAVMRLLKQDMGNRISSLDDAISGIKGRIAPGAAASSAAGAAAPRVNPFRK